MSEPLDLERPAEPEPSASQIGAEGRGQASTDTPVAEATQTRADGDVVNAGDGEDTLLHKAETVMRAGIMMLAAGTGSRRVKELMRAVARALGLDTLEAQITFTEIICTVSQRGDYWTLIGEIPQPGVNADRIARLQHLTTILQEPMTVAQVNARLDRIERRKPIAPVWLNAAIISVACTSVAVLNGATWREMILVILASLVASRLRYFLAQQRLNQLASVFLAALVSTGMYTLLSTAALTWWGWPMDRQAAGLVASAIFLVPGFPLITASLDLARLDLEAGIARLIYAGLVTMSAAMAFWFVATVSHSHVQSYGYWEIAPVLVWLILAAATFCGGAGWSFMFNTPWRICITTGLISVAGNLPRLAAIHYGVPAYVSTAIAACLIGLLSHWVGNIFKLPRIIMTVPATIIMVPGGSAYRAFNYLSAGDYLEAIHWGVETAMVVIAICVGLVVARTLTDAQWAYALSDNRSVRALPTEPIQVKVAHRLPRYLPRLPHRPDRHG